MKGPRSPWGLKVFLFLLLLLLLASEETKPLMFFVVLLKKIGKSRILAMLAYLLRRVPHCGDFFAHPLGGATEAIWLHTVGSRSKASPDRKKRPGTRGLVVYGTWIRAPDPI